MKVGEGIRQPPHIYDTCVCVWYTYMQHRDMDNSVGIDRGKGWAEVELDKTRKWYGKRLCLGDGRMMQCADDVLLSCTLETYMVL